MRFTIDDLMQLLVSKVGLPSDMRTQDPGKTFGDLGLDSLAFLQLQSELQEAYGFELPDDRPLAFSVGDMTAAINERLSRDEEPAA
ncbi:acetyl-CoA carboxylase, biotin carboxylase subunit/minimal PKS acyl carrier protein [Asanoa hainanensis]|uniref:Acetyl-CoA carboxylase, biotin carboxylase subunit/minimal PKS acyl carrier protein n=1 Tax=Asanoa hainanensis TaxID=560556 RepID=A0A239NIL6_9ACTN|nr:acyl carrier protein [Asanoa hainanensis]SNT54715.1 acetyl-CoA carboxylase, biotin carboxylase subunit/minimal PKS acyl carrier protein [Asanoa hainanensis]